MAGSKRGSRSSSSRSGSGTRSGSGCLIWLIALCVVFVLIFVNLGRIRQTLESTKFLDIVSTKGGQKPPAPAPSPVSPAPRVEEEPTKKPREKPASGGDAVTVDPGTKPGPVAPPRTDPGAAKHPETQSDKPGTAKSRTASLYFVKIDGDGVIARQEVKRTIPATDSPLTDAIGSLLKGPGEDELRKELITLIPQGTRLLSAQVRGTTAYLNFSEAFMYNSYGIEGYAGQLKQVVWTATSFPTVQDVQILVEGQRRDFLGGEGVYIGQPLSRNSF